MITIEQQLTEKDYAYFVDFSIFERKPFNKIFLLYIAPLLGIALLVSFFALDEESNALFIVLCVFLIVLGWIMKLVFRRMAISNFKKNPVLGLKNTIKFQETEIVMESVQGSSKNVYDVIDKVYVLNDYVIAYLNTQQFLGINTSNLTQGIKDELMIILKDKCLGKVQIKTK